ncbi:Protein of unknown function [Bacillus mycoides]|uniref:Uncharacterized protein n=1 Tax=Bacillus mycoides TaxID=1405 RepID=A0A1C4CVZ8_BACMY|nr:Protein of unknown function [Bacillus mycoides]SCC23222.1 Protein of unknown function [Bacillus mycoides]
MMMTTTTITTIT